MKSDIHVLLTGASGTVGIEVLRKLVEMDNIKLTVFDKKTPRVTKLYAPFLNKIDLIYGDLSHEVDISWIPDDLDVVIHLAAIIPPLADAQPDLTYKVNVRGTKQLIKVLESNSPNAFLMYSSSISVYGDRVLNPEITIDDPLNPSEGDLYGRTKVEAEELIKCSQLNWSIFRLAAIMKNHKISKLMFHMPLSTSLEICTPKDTAKAFVEGIFKKEVLSGKVYNLGGGEKCRISYQHFLEKSFRLFGLGSLNFPKYAFAEKNFHCGIFKDGDDLENILHFRHDTLDSYFAETKHSISIVTKFITSLFRVFIKQSLLKQSEPRRAIQNKDIRMLQHFFSRDYNLNFE